MVGAGRLFTPNSPIQKCNRIELMLSDLEYTYSPVRDRVRDLREYL